MSDAIQQFSNWRQFKVKEQAVKGYELVLRQFCLFLRNPKVEDIKLVDILQFFGLMDELGWKRNSFIPKAQAIKKFFEFLRLQGYFVINEELIPIPSKEYNMPRVLNESSYQQLLNVIPLETNDPRHIRNRAIVMMLHDTGARAGEIVSLDVDDLDMERKRAVIKTEKSKGRRPIREIFWNDGANQSLRVWIDKREVLLGERESNALFISVAGLKTCERLTIKGLGELLRRYSNTAKLPNHVNAHSFRHRIGHEVVKKGGSAADVMNILGHSTLASSTIYTMMVDKELEERHRKLLS